MFNKPKKFCQSRRCVLFCLSCVDIVLIKKDLLSKRCPVYTCFFLVEKKRANQIEYSLLSHKIKICPFYV